MTTRDYDTVTVYKSEMYLYVNIIMTNNYIKNDNNNQYCFNAQLNK